MDSTRNRRRARWPKGKPRGQRSIEQRRFCRQMRPRVVSYGPAKGKALSEVDDPLLRWYRCKTWHRPLREAVEQELRRRKLSMPLTPEPEPSPEKRGRPMREIDVDLVLRRKAAGCSTRAISKELNVPESTIRLHLKRAKKPVSEGQFSAHPNEIESNELGENRQNPPHTPPELPEVAAFVTREKTAAVRNSPRTEKPKQPTEAEIEEALSDWGKRRPDKAAIVRILRALAKHGLAYADFRTEAARRVREYRPDNRIGFVIRLAESGQIFGEHEMTIEEQVAAYEQSMAERPPERDPLAGW